MPVAVGAMLVLAARLWLAALFLVEGWAKVRIYDAAGAYMQAYGVPAALLPLVIAGELGGALLLIFGLWTRMASLGLAVFCLVAAALFHANWQDHNQLLHFLKDLAIAGGLSALAAGGAGRWSVDSRFRGSNSAL